MRFILTGFMSLLAAVPASAGLLGQNIEITYDITDNRYTDTVLVGPGTEITCPGAFNICGALPLPTTFLDAADTSITYSYDGASGPLFFNTGPDFRGFEFAKLDAGGNVLGPVVLTTNIDGLDMSRVSTTSNTIRLDMRTLPIDEGSYFTVSFGSGTPIPEPSTVGMTVLGALAFLGRRSWRPGRR